ENFTDSLVCGCHGLLSPVFGLKHIEHANTKSKRTTSFHDRVSRRDRRLPAALAPHLWEHPPMRLHAAAGIERRQEIYRRSALREPLDPQARSRRELSRNLQRLVAIVGEMRVIRFGTAAPLRAGRECRCEELDVHTRVSTSVASNESIGNSSGGRGSSAGARCGGPSD